MTEYSNIEHCIRKSLQTKKRVHAERKLQNFLERTSTKLTKEQKKAIKSNATIFVCDSAEERSLLYAYRFLWLLLSGVDANRILTIAETEESARELEKAVNELVLLASDKDERFRELVSEGLPKHSILTTDFSEKNADFHKNFEHLIFEVEPGLV